jgi:hypothetical protein
MPEFYPAAYFLFFFFTVLWNYFFVLQLYIGVFVDNLRRFSPLFPEICFQVTESTGTSIQHHIQTDPSSASQQQAQRGQRRPADQLEGVRGENGGRDSQPFSAAIFT